MNLKARILSLFCLSAALMCPMAAGAQQGGGRQGCKADGKKHTAEARAMLATLRALPAKGVFMFGHHDDPVYGIGWENEPGRSDVKSVCGDWPAVMSFDLGRIERGGDKNIDGVPFGKIRQEAVAQYARGGMVAFSWHADNPVTGNDSWDTSDTTAVRSVMPGGKNYGKFISWLDRVADFLNSIRTADGVKVPVIFRPWHEHTGSWFWWGQALCTDEEYAALWQMTYKRMREKGADQVIWAYSPGLEPQDSAAYLERYPGDGIVDLIGVDCYQFDKRADYIANLDRMLRIMTEVSKAHGKPMAVTETGLEGLADPAWWTGTLMPIIEKYPISYVLVWRNAHDKPGHFYAPYPGQASAADFVKFYNDGRTLFAKDMEKALKSKKVKE